MAYLITDSGLIIKKEEGISTRDIAEELIVNEDGRYEGGLESKTEIVDKPTDNNVVVSIANITEDQERGSATSLEEVVIAMNGGEMERFEITVIDIDKIPEKPTSRQKITIAQPQPKKIRKLEGFACEVCRRVYVNESSLLVHSKSHRFYRNTAMKSDSETDKPYECETCGKNFKTSTLRWQHEFIHKEDRNYECEICHKKFKTNSNLKQHKYGHATEKAFQCSQCPKRFKKKAVLTRHELNHTAERSFTCDVCDFSFKFKDQLKVHQKKICNNLNKIQLMKVINNKKDRKIFRENSKFGDEK